MNCIHLVLYARGEPYETTQRMISETVHANTKYKVIIHNYSLARIATCDWYYDTGLCNLPFNKNKEQLNGRDGFYNLWKGFITYDVYNVMGDNDLLYYVDSSQHFCTGFTDTIDKLCEFAFTNGAVAGSAGYDTDNILQEGCDKVKVWREILKDPFDESILRKAAILNSWFLFAKNEKNTCFLKDWIYYSMLRNERFEYPLGTYHHTIDQSIFNILVHKYNFLYFYEETIKHNDNKDRNLVLKILNSNDSITKYFRRFNSYTYV